MKLRYLLPGLILIALGLGVGRVFLYYGFAGALLCAVGAAVLVFCTVDALKKRWPRAMRRTQRVLCVLLALVLIAAAATGVWVGVCCGGAAEPEAQYLIVLGAGVNGTQPSRSLYERLRAAEAYLRTYPETIAILSGGQGDNENISEAECMYRWLTAAGIAPERLRREEQATSTKENLEFSLALIEAETGTRPETVAVVSSEYHLCRTELLAQKSGITAKGVPAPTTNRIYFTQMLLREICGVWYTLLTNG